jgi:hypothetical protein
VTDPTVPLPTAAGTVAKLGTAPPPNPALKALEDAWTAIKAEVESPAAERFLINGVVTFLSAEFPPAAPFLGFAETFVLKLLKADQP